jgi:catechol 2,3-dioxygenase-like lactoylglutathione lyase family enzyme
MAIPILRCADLERTIAFYTDVIGATLQWRDHTGPGPAYASVRWRDHELHLSSHAGDSAFGTAIYILVDDVDAVFAELCAHGWQPPTDRGPVHAGPTDQTWDMREAYVLDPDGNSLRFAAPVSGRGAPVSSR